MQVTAAILLALHCILGLAIRVPVAWNDLNSEVNLNNQFAVESFAPQNEASSNRKPIPAEYFQYAAQKPKFAVNIAKFHDVPSPENHYKAHPVKPHTGAPKPELGKHQMLNEEKNIFRPYQEFVKKNEAIRTVSPSTTSYEVFHPYKLEEPALKELYRDPVMDKIRNDLLNSKNRLQKYENEPKEPDIQKGEYLESPEETDLKKVPHKNVPAPYEIHLPQRRPVYYILPPVHNNRDQVLNQKLRHPWHQNYVKVKPIHYRPVKNHLQRLRQHHALKYDDERNEYPQLPIPEKHSEPSEGYDIYEKGKAKFNHLRNNVDEAINEAVQKNIPVVPQKTELNDDETNEDSVVEKDEDEFVPIKNYAQVRKTETTKHLPREAAYDDADTLEEIINAPRLREAVKSTKAQTVYSEEGYEDSAYNHAGEQKHASDHEAHGGFLKEKELSEGKFKIPTFSAKYNEEDGSEYRDQVLDGKKWKDNKKDTEEDKELEEFSEKEQEHSEESKAYKHQPNNREQPNNNENDNGEIDDLIKEENDRTKREQTPTKSTIIETTSESLEKEIEHDVNKREAVIEVPAVEFDSTKKDSSESSKLKELSKTITNSHKYPYYFTKFTAINKDSPLRYAENLKLIPKKSEGGTEFYDSRSKLECPEVDDVDPIPEKLKKGGHPDGDEDDEDDEDNIKKDKSDFSTLDQKPRLRGLGDKIDCFKAKYFGENPLDSPFFKEEIIANPEPVTIPSIDIYKLKQAKEQAHKNLKPSEKQHLIKELQEKSKIDMFTVIDKLYPKEIIEVPNIQVDYKNGTSIPSQTKSTDIHPVSHNSESVLKSKSNNGAQLQIRLRKKRATPFVYEPYKIIRDGQVQDSKKTTTTNNISPLIKQLQSSRVVDKVTPNPGKEQIVKRNAGSRGYKDIGKSDREKTTTNEKGSQPVYDASFVDVSIDQRRGEPRYELRLVNHKSQDTPTENKKYMTAEDYKAHVNENSDSGESDLSDNKKEAKRRQRITTKQPYFDVSKFLPQADEEKSDASSDKIEMTVRPKSRFDKATENNDNTEEYEEDDSDKEIEQTTIATTTKKSPRRRRMRILTTVKPEKEEHLSVTNAPILRLKTRFRDSHATETPVIPQHVESTTQKVQNKDDSITAPKYRVKKKKSTERTLVTDTKSYGEEDDDDLGKEEVDALIGVKEDDSEYLPTYEKPTGRDITSDSSNSQDDDEDYDEDDHSYEDDDDEYDDDDEEEDEVDDETEEENEHTESTSPEPTKRSLVRTTETPPATTEARSARLELKPIISKKKYEVHKELPVNKSSPHISEFKQDIKEEEVIKEMPSKLKKKPQKHIEALELYKDENLAKDVNKLGGVEIFKEGLDLVNGPKHGGNYRNAEELEKGKNSQKPTKSDVVGSQSKTSKHIELNDDAYSRRKSNIQRARNGRGRSAKFIELSDATEKPPLRPMHGGNFKSIHDVRRRGGNRNAKLELDDHNTRHDHSTSTNGRDFKSYGSRGGDRHQMHGGNYRSAKLVQADDTKDKSLIHSESIKKDVLKDNIRDEPVFHTLPSYILDPSKRMYYYVDA